MDTKNILLLTDVFPCDNYSGAIVSSQICQYLLNAGYSLFCACVHNPGVHENISRSLQDQIQTINFVKPPENQLTKKEYLAQIEPVADSIVHFIKEHHIEAIWCPLQGESLLRILNHILTQIKNIKLITQIWDPFEWHLTELGYSETEKLPLLAMFDKIIRKSDYCLTASSTMQDRYSQKYQVPCAPVFASYPSTNFSTQSRKPSSKYVIAISGQTYATSGITSFLDALSKMHWNYQGKSIIIKYYGSKPEIFKKYHNHVVICGQVPQAKLVEKQHQADLLYCPYFFDSSVPTSVASESYPSKIVTYLASKVPILIHADESSPVYQDFKSYQCGFLLSSTNPAIISKKLRSILSAKPAVQSSLVRNSEKLFTTRFTPAINQKTVFHAFKSLKSSSLHPRILEINNIDLPGRLWNGYDLMNYLNRDTRFNANQICTYKTSDNDDVVKLYKTQKELDLEYETLKFEENRLSVHSCISMSTPALLQSSVYQNSDLLHFHLIHNMKISLFSLIKMCNQKPSIISIHDPWIFTGHCVHFGDCDRYLTGCEHCPYLNIMFPIKYDTSSELWKLKQFVYNHIDVDYVVSTQYMYDLFKSSPLTKDKPVHLIPFGMDVNKFSKISSEEARKHYHIPKDHIVLFHRAQQAFKGTNFFVDALKQLHVKPEITIITCGELGLLDSIKDRYQLIELGNIGDDELTYAYNACDIFVMPSIGESFGMMSVEAMSCEKPVICFNNTALPSVIHAPECGIAAENLNSTELMKAIRHLIDDPADRLRRGHLAREIVKTTYNTDIYNAKMLALYEEVLKRKHITFKIPSSVSISHSVITLKKELNTLTKTLLPRSSAQFKKLHYKVPIRSPIDYHKIEYHSLPVQLLLDEYNQNLYNYYLEDIKPSLPRRFYNKTKHFSKLFVELLKNDPATLIKVTKKRLGLPQGKEKHD